MSNSLPYSQWTQDEHARWILAGNTFGHHVMESARDYALNQIPKNVSPEALAVSQQAIHNALYGMMMILDGITENRIDNQHRVEYVLATRIHSHGKTVEMIELTPNGDGLCIGFHGWVDEHSTK